MYKIFQREHAIHISNDQLNLDDYDMIFNNPSKRVLEQLIMNLDDLRKKPKKIWIRANEQEYFDKIRFLFREIKAGGGAVFNPLGELLIIKRLGFWDLPKGKWQKGETIEECAIREVEEECNVFGLQIINTLIPTYHLYNYRGKWAIKKSIWYTMHSQDWQLAKPQLEEDIEEIKWVKLDDPFMQDLHTYPAIREVLKELIPKA
jgi:8-oxo-dGTP pyrophosphatase MutT (NUDIX family)